MSFFDILQLLGGTVLAIGYVPQIIQILRTKSCGDISLKTYLFLTIGIGLMEIYAINLSMSDTGIMFLITNSLSLILVLTITCLLLVFRRNRSNMSKTKFLILGEGSDKQFSADAYGTALIKDLPEGTYYISEAGIRKEDVTTSKIDN